jgi:hypothetical protein
MVTSMLRRFMVGWSRARGAGSVDGATHGAYHGLGPVGYALRDRIQWE